METKNKLSDNTSRIITFLLTGFALAVFTAFFLIVRAGRYPDDSFAVEGPFDLAINGKTFEAVDLDTFSFPAVVRGDHLILSFDLPEARVPNPILTFYQDHMAVQVYYDNELMFEKGSPSSLMVGYGYHSVTLPEDYTGIHVTIVIDVIENEGVKSLIRPVINNSAAYLHNFIVDNSFYLVIDIAIITLCIAIMLIACIFSAIMPMFRRLVFLGIAFFMMAVWELCSYDLIKVFSDDLVFKGYMEYTSLYWGPFFLAIYFYIEFFKDAGEKTRKIYSIITAVQGSFSLIAFILHFADIIHLPAVLSVFHIILIMNVGFMFIVLMRRFVKKDDSHRPMAVGLIIIVILAAFDLIRFIIYKTFFTRYLENFISFLLLGFFLFLLAMLMDFFMNQKKSMYVVAQAEAMDRLAHVDIMTGLANRRRCEEIFLEIEQNKDIFAIISIDLNFLKLTNDQYGHLEGDKLLTDLAGLMKEACEDEPVTAGRMGGDEFIIIIPKLENDIDRVIMERMEMICARINKDRTPLPLSFAYGNCRSNEVNAVREAAQADKTGTVREAASDDETGTVREAASDDETGIVERACQIADERMYDMKKKMKARREDVL
ncbi:MAG: diguanylate cyclase [Lachnospiraceae bacterium]|nr:diguanylate cyclase [Lachnospiraceae bacterium]